MLSPWLVPDEAFDPRRRTIAWPRNLYVGSCYAIGAIGSLLRRCSCRDSVG